jgi:hypothetical protein
LTGDRGLYSQGSFIDYVTTISTLGNAATFGTLSVSRTYFGACTSNGTNNRAILAGGNIGSSNIIDYVTITSLGNADDFGDLVYTMWQFAATSNGTNNRGVWGGGDRSGGAYNSHIGYVTISTLGNAATFGSLTVGRTALAATSNA